MDFCKEHGERCHIPRKRQDFLASHSCEICKKRSEICKKISSTFTSLRFAIKMLDFPDRIQWQKTFLKLAEGVNEGNRMASNFSKTLVGPKLFNGGSPKPI